MCPISKVSDTLEFLETLKTLEYWESLESFEGVSYFRGTHTQAMRAPGSRLCQCKDFKVSKNPESLESLECLEFWKPWNTCIGTLGSRGSASRACGCHGSMKHPPRILRISNIPICSRFTRIPRFLKPWKSDNADISLLHVFTFLFSLFSPISRLNIVPWEHRTTTSISHLRAYYSHIQNASRRKKMLHWRRVFSQKRVWTRFHFKTRLDARNVSSELRPDAFWPEKFVHG